jgi:hypothetical protein
MILIVLAALAIHTTSFAQNTQDTEDAAIQASLDARDQFITSLEHKDFQGMTHQAFDAAVKNLADQVRTEYNDSDMADSLLKQWTSASANFDKILINRLNNKDLGDHDPLFPWLAAYIKQLADKYGQVIYSLQIVKDIVTLNYAIPVVFNPHGHWQVAGVDSRIEYRLHFIPFADVVTYYVVLYGCKYELSQHGAGNLGQLCSKAAEKLEYVMGRYIAPVVSDWIFKQTNSSIEITDGQRQYNTVEDLRSAIQH